MGAWAREDKPPFICIVAKQSEAGWKLFFNNSKRIQFMESVSKTENFVYL